MIEQIPEVENIVNGTETIAATLERLIDSAIFAAVCGAVLNPEEGVDYLPKTHTEALFFEAHAWVKNAVLLGVMAGAEHAGRRPKFVPQLETLNSTAIAVMQGGNAYGQMQSIAREG